MSTERPSRAELEQMRDAGTLYWVFSDDGVELHGPFLHSRIPEKYLGWKAVGFVPDIVGRFLGSKHKES